MISSAGVESCRFDGPSLDAVEDSSPKSTSRRRLARDLGLPPSVVALSVVLGLERLGLAGGILGPLLLAVATIVFSRC